MQAVAETIENIDTARFAQFIPGQTFAWCPKVNKAGTFDNVPMNGWIKLFSMAFSDLCYQYGNKLEVVKKTNSGLLWVTNPQYRAKTRALVLQVQPLSHGIKGYVTIVLFNPQFDTIDMCIKWIE